MITINGINGHLFRCHNAFIFHSIKSEFFIFCNGQLIKMDKQAKIKLAFDVLFTIPVMIKSNRITIQSEKLLLS